MFALLTTLALASDPLMHQHWSSSHTPRGVVETLNQQHGEILDTDLITPLDGLHDVPPLLTAVVVHNFLENFTRNEPKYRHTGFGKGGRIQRNPRSVIYQLGGKVDGGLWEDIKQRRRDLVNQHKDTGVRPPLDDMNFIVTAGLLESFITAEMVRLSAEKNMTVTTVHFVAYLGPGGLSCHRDLRLDGPESRRAILAAPSNAHVPGAPRLKFWFAQESEEGEPAGKRYFGACGGNLLLTGPGSGGFFLFPPTVPVPDGLTDAQAAGLENGRAWFLYHEPWARVPGDAGLYNPNDIRGSFVFTGREKRPEE